jgi:hypothetical protein
VDGNTDFQANFTYRLPEFDGGKDRIAGISENQKQAIAFSAFFNYLAAMRVDNAGGQLIVEFHPNAHGIGVAFPGVGASHDVGKNQCYGARWKVYHLSLRMADAPVIIH